MKSPAFSDLPSKKSVASVYETPAFNTFLKDTLHPGGHGLTRRMAEMGQADPASAVLDLACGKASGSLLLAGRLGCRVTGIDISKRKIIKALQSAKDSGLLQGDQARFLVSDAENLPFSRDSFDLVLSECSFSILPNKQSAAEEIGRVLAPGGRVVLADLFFLDNTREEVDGLLSDPPGKPLLPCLAGAARSLQDYIDIFEAAGFRDPAVEDHSMALKGLGYRIALTFGGWKDFLGRLSSEIPGMAQATERETEGAVDWNHRILSKARLGYALIKLRKP